MWTTSYSLTDVLGRPYVNIRLFRVPLNVGSMTLSDPNPTPDLNLPLNLPRHLTDVKGMTARDRHVTDV